MALETDGAATLIPFFKISRPDATHCGFTNRAASAKIRAEEPFGCSFPQKM
jgi:hypothetical protein